MAKYDRYTLFYQAGKDENYLTATIEVLLEDGDDIAVALSEANNTLEAQISELKQIQEDNK